MRVFVRAEKRRSAAAASPRAAHMKVFVLSESDLTTERCAPVAAFQAFVLHEITGFAASHSSGQRRASHLITARRATPSSRIFVVFASLRLVLCPRAWKPQQPPPHLTPSYYAASARCGDNIH